MTPQPLFVLAPPHGEASRVAALLGSHPAAFFVPELNLTLADRAGDLLDLFYLADASGLQDGLLRTVAALFCGGQTPDGIKAAQRWLKYRVDRSTDDLLWEIAERVAPRQLVVPEISAIWRPDLLRRLDRQFPDSRWLHVVRHPRQFSLVTIAAFRERLFVPADYLDHNDKIDPPAIDPQVAWYRVHLNFDAAEKIRAVPGLTHRIRVEVLLSAPERQLTKLAQWMGLETDEASLAAMMAPECSIFAGRGPPGAIEGMDPEFIDKPDLEYGIRPLTSLDGPLPWRDDGTGFVAEVRALANSYGYG